MNELEASKAIGSVMERLEGRNEMSETPLTREADEIATNVMLLLEAGPVGQTWIYCICTTGE